MSIDKNNSATSNKNRIRGVRYLTIELLNSIDVDEEVLEFYVLTGKEVPPSKRQMYIQISTDHVEEYKQFLLNKVNP